MVEKRKEAIKKIPPEHSQAFSIVCGPLRDRLPVSSSPCDLFVILGKVLGLQSCGPRFYLVLHTPICAASGTCIQFSQPLATLHLHCHPEVRVLVLRAVSSRPCGLKNHNDPANPGQRG